VARRTRCPGSEFAQRLTGSSDLYETSGRRPVASVNFVTCHDGFTLADLVSYGDLPVPARRTPDEDVVPNAQRCDERICPRIGRRRGCIPKRRADASAPRALVGASMVVTYVHDRGPLVLPGSDRVYEPTGKDLVLNVSDAVRIDSDGMITDRWSGLSFAHLHWELKQNATL
jgi:hypothetical protein